MTPPGRRWLFGHTPRVSLDHLYRLTDSRGIYQHARGSRPNPDYGYCLDDNARALIVCVRARPLLGENGLLDYIRHYMAFVERCQLPDGRFRNFMAADGGWLDELGSEDSNGRAIWALGFAARHSVQTEIRLRALHCLDLALDSIGQLTWPRARAFALMGLRLWREAEPAPTLDRLIDEVAAELADIYARSASAEWRWFEDELTYDNPRLPEALLGTSQAQLGVESLTWLCRTLEDDERISLIGNNGWYRHGGQRAVYDQQPVDAAALVSACVAAHWQTGEARFHHWAELAYGWFLGRNVEGHVMIDPETGGCYDGLEEGRVNRNQGAESLLSWLLAWEDMAEQGWL